MKRPSSFSHCRGFTLIELILSLAIAAIVLTAINSVFFAALRLRDATVKVAQEAAPVERALGILKKDFAGIMPPGTIPGVMGTDATMIGVTQPLIVEFYSTTGIIQDGAPFGDVQKIDYWLQDSPNRNSGAVGKDLMRGGTPNLLPSSPVAPTSQKILSGVQNMRISYFDGTNWNDSWSTQLSNTPVAMKVFLTFATPKNGSPISPPVQFYVPIVTVVSSNIINSTNSVATPTNSAAIIGPE